MLKSFYSINSAHFSRILHRDTSILQGKQDSDARGKICLFAGQFWATWWPIIDRRSCSSVLSCSRNFALAQLCEDRYISIVWNRAVSISTLRTKTRQQGNELALEHTTLHRCYRSGLSGSPYLRFVLKSSLAQIRI